MQLRFADKSEAALPLHLVEMSELEAWCETLDDAARTWVRAQGFSGAIGERVVLPGPDGQPLAAAVGYGTAVQRSRTRFVLAAGAASLPAGTYQIASGLPPEMAEALWRLIIGWGIQYEEERLRED